jgi:SulP family sulfate permease
MPGIVFSIIMLITQSKIKHFLVVPILLLIAITLSHIFLAIMGIPLSEAIENTWFLEPVQTSQIGLVYSVFAQVDWGLISSNIVGIISITILIPIVVLLNGTGLEIALQKDTDLDEDLSANGLANIASGLVGATVGHMGPANTLMNAKLGGNNRLSGIVASSFCALVFFIGGNLLSYIPIFVVGTLILAVGLELLIEWVYFSYKKLSRFDYTLVLLILGIIAYFGFLEGVAIGIVIASLFFVVNYSRLDVTRYIQSGTTQQSNVQRSYREQKLLQENGDKICILKLQGYLFFGTANNLLTQVRSRIADPDLPEINFLILDFRLVNGLDTSAVLSFVKIKQILEQVKCYLIFTNLQEQIEKQLKQGGVFENNESENQIDSRCQVFPDYDYGLEWCENHILDAQENSEGNVLPQLSEQLTELFLAPEQSPEFMGYLTSIKASEGEYIFKQGDPPDGIYFLEQGQVSIFLEFANGMTKRLRTFRGGNIFGEMGLYENAPRSASVIADEPSILYLLSNQSFEKMEQENPNVASTFHKFIVSLLAQRLKHREKELRSLQ